VISDKTIIGIRAYTLHCSVLLEFNGRRGSVFRVNIRGEAVFERKTIIRSKKNSGLFVLRIM
jgi:hypothetical protein